MKKIILVILFGLGLGFSVVAKAEFNNWFIVEGTMKKLDKNVITLTSTDGEVRVFKSALMGKDKKFASGKLAKAKVSKEEFVLLNVIY